MKVDTLRHGATVTGRMATAITWCENEDDGTYGLMKSCKEAQTGY